MKNFNEFKKIIDEIEKSQGQKLNSMARLLEISFKLMVINFGYLKKWIQKVPVFSIEQRDTSKEFQIESLRHFVNFLNSAVAFKEHTRKYVTDIYGDPKVALGGIYQAKVAVEFGTDPLTKFIEELRNIYNHQKVLPVGIETRIENGLMKPRVKIFKKKLIKDYGLSPKAKSFLVKIPDNENIDILKISEEYLYKSLFPWLMTQQNIVHKQQFEELNELRSKARKLFEE